MRTARPNLPAPTGGMLLAKRPTGIIMAIVVVAIAIVAQSIPSTLASIPAVIEANASGVPLDPETATDFGPFNQLVALCSFAVTLLVIWLWVTKKEKRGFATLGFAPSFGWAGKAARGLAVGIGMLMLCALVPIVTGAAQLTWAAPDARTWFFVALMLVFFLLQGSTEEVLLRGFLTQAIARRWGLAAAIVLQAVLFSALHGLNPGITWLALLNIATFAVFASFYTLADGSLWGICAMHGAWNWAQGNLFGVAVSGSAVSDALFGLQITPGASNLLTGGEFGIEGSLVTTIVYLVGIAVCWTLWRKRRALASNRPTSGGATNSTTDGMSSDEPARGAVSPTS